MAGVKSSDICDLWACGIYVGGLFSSHVLTALPASLYRHKLDCRYPTTQHFWRFGGNTGTIE